jgi:ABC-type antimicrobial peptide transport system permease subunit
MMATLSGIYGILAAVLAMVGIYRIISYMVVRRRNEIGVRIALGADKVNILGMILGEALTLLVIGLVAGTGRLLPRETRREPCSLGSRRLIRYRWLLRPGV